jgi:hypothetical protein
VRKFRKVGGFKDDTDYIEVHDNGDVFLVTLDGRRVMQDHRFARNVYDGLEYGTLDWEEVA